jgi:UDP-N-acetyl-D-galactosamine dehydrogenase
MMDPADIRLAVIEIGYLGLPLAVEFGRITSVLGFDIHIRRIAPLKAGIDQTLETIREKLKKAAHHGFTAVPSGGLKPLYRDGSDSHRRAQTPRPQVCI